MYPGIRLSARTPDLRAAMKVTGRLCHRQVSVTQSPSPSQILEMEPEEDEGVWGAVGWVIKTPGSWNGGSRRRRFLLPVCHIISICLSLLSKTFVSSCDPDPKCVPWGRRVPGIWGKGGNMESWWTLCRWTRSEPNSTGSWRFETRFVLCILHFRDESWTLKASRAGLLNLQSTECLGSWTHFRQPLLVRVLQRSRTDRT